MKWFGLLLLILITALLLIKVNPKSKIDYQQQYEEEKRIEYIKDSLAKKINDDIENDYLKTLDSSPVKIVKSWVTENSIGTPILHMTIRNASRKGLDGIKFGIYCYNNFNERVSGSTFNLDHEKGAMLQRKLGPGKSETYTWKMYSMEGTTKVKPYIREIHFTDNSTWDSNKIVFK